MMHMTFYWGKNVTLLFDFWKTDSWTTYTLTLLACFIISILYQYMEHHHLRFKFLVSTKTIAQDGSFVASSSTATVPLLYSRNFLKVARFAGAVQFGVNSAIGYLLMLTIMSFNGGVFIAVVLGLAFGYLLFRTNYGDYVVGAANHNPCACTNLVR